VDPQGGSALVLKRQVTWDNAVLPAQAQVTEVLDGVYNVNFTYYDGSLASWVNSWSTTDKQKSTNNGFHGLLPELIKIEVYTGSADNSTYLETIAGVTVYEK
jgi:hypothetical protein